MAAFALPAPGIWLDNNDTFSSALADGFIVIEGQEDNDRCWVSISRCATDVTGDEECSLLADVKTRGSWLFARGVAYAFCKAWGRIVFNDAGELDGEERYSAEPLKEAIHRLA
ncbi:hypothetical protein OU994_25175 [Pseudoduganella sp. SL102]|uniref:hypothetical protein n=1 Tax=Pseudoduganella sp. SL102 TaxID=2995154 RepID=UPI00248C275B|nr:hypothetical protein [Pseudoduganella sp. SL102]WBS01535.1 hypothetical protein OU994_25175 [Pseudoduganella sp. SL102]